MELKISKVKGESFSSENDSFLRLLTLSKPGIRLFFATISAQYFPSFLKKLAIETRSTNVKVNISKSRFQCSCGHITCNSTLELDSFSVGSTRIFTRIMC